ncbi:multicopper oxidase domain-containing protein [Paenibacillus sp. GP183]|nr:multicopper oxidase domain-containing protein [Paenibacillus sp. GP183]
MSRLTQNVIAFAADNPGLWMLHCHNLDHSGQRNGYDAEL